MAAGPTSPAEVETTSAVRPTQGVMQRPDAFGEMTYRDDQARVACACSVADAHVDGRKRHE
jgi:hypothetical protein